MSEQTERVERLRRKEENALEQLAIHKRKLRRAEALEDWPEVDAQRGAVRELETELEAISNELGSLSYGDAERAQLEEAALRNRDTFDALYAPLLRTLAKAVGHQNAEAHPHRGICEAMLIVTRALDGERIEVPTPDHPNIHEMEAHLDGAVELWADLDELLAKDKRVWTKLTSFDDDVELAPLTHKFTGGLRPALDNIRTIRINQRNEADPRSKRRRRSRTKDEAYEKGRAIWLEAARKGNRNWGPAARADAARYGVTLPSNPQPRRKVVTMGGTLDARALEEQWQEERKRRRMADG